MPWDDTAVDDTAVYVMKVDMLDGVTILRSEKVKDEIVLDGNDIELAFYLPYQPTESNRIQTLSLLMRMVMLPQYFLFDVMQMSLLYFEAQLSRRLPHGQRVAWRDHFGLTDGLEEGVRPHCRIVPSLLLPFRPAWVADQSSYRSVGRSGSGC
ncbi:uncharacterized protein LOC123397452 [Hordeum vulgare subsp. vulgare]|uniref:uncharacterized protein LOC123397452 n=1 Tax=Hordeum vulgare subsp. vulgare TaxID=112509 RepID=UPI001D1A57F9|nr:uncharacterized protein LOC123397452 [Hordeum vulgare subsp. vulgare]